MSRIARLKPTARAARLGMMSMSFHLGYITGPSVGGFLVDTVGWRWIFFMNLPVAIAASWMAWKILPETVTESRDYSIDPIGMVTLLITVVGVIVGAAASRQIRLRRFPRGSADRLRRFILFVALFRTRGTRRRCWISRCSKCVCLPPACSAIFLCPCRTPRRFFCCRFTCRGFCISRRPRSV